MTEEEWLTSAEPDAMIKWMRWRHPVHHPARRSNRWRFDDRRARLWVEACRAAEAVANLPLATQWFVENLQSNKAELRACVNTWASDASSRYPVSMKARADLLREIVGNPYRETELPKGAVTREVKRLAQVALKEDDSKLECKKCDGKGKVDKLEKYDARRHGGERKRRVVGKKKCPSCEGTGRLLTRRLVPANLAVLCDALVERGLEEEECFMCEGTGKRWRCRRCRGTWALPAKGDQACPTCPRSPCEPIKCREGCAGTGRAPHPVLAHLREDGPHIRGCWAIDLLLGKT